MDLRTGQGRLHGGDVLDLGIGGAGRPRQRSGNELRALHGLAGLSPFIDHNDRPSPSRSGKRGVAARRPSTNDQHVTVMDGPARCAHAYTPDSIALTSA